MKFTFRIKTAEVKGFLREIEIISSQSFYDFHNALSINFHYDASQPASFFTTNEKWNRLQEISLFDYSEGKNSDIHLMDKSKINDFVKVAGDRLLYIFDYFNDRYMCAELLSVSETEEDVKYPRIIKAEKSPPPQLLIIETNIGDLDFDE